MGLTLDKANDQLEDIGLKVKAKDVNDDKAIIAKKNWEVVSQDPGKATSAAKGSTVQLGVRHLTDATASPSPTATTAPAPLVAPPAVETPAAVAPAAPAPPAAEPAPAQVQPAPAPAAPYYKNCDAVRAAGAAPIHSSQPGYGRHLDRDGDGWGCDK
ncbi:excalibur calcium-binding domain-containing protein [Paenarthrobacter sp. NPDC018779]|uniref:excalibur calcium-binding domain-containing protein n=1 Tax=Paenarthrobacter sp. NPDC018779 TaxID=3364375 RepID=UPI0037C5576F